MFHLHDSHTGDSQTERDQLVQSWLDYYSGAPRPIDAPDPRAWEAGNPIPVKPGPWVWLVLIIIIGFVALVII